jgi:uncharacterized RDD family membrane protein YckC
LTGWWRRVGATVVDALIFFVVALVIELLVHHVVGAVITGALSVAYFIYLWAQPRGQTVGNIAVGTQVRSAGGGGPITLQQSVIRWACLALPVWISDLLGSSALSSVVSLYLLVDILFPLWDSRNQTIHDKVAKTVVVLAPTNL